MPQCTPTQHKNKGKKKKNEEFSKGPLLLGTLNTRDLMRLLSLCFGCGSSDIF
jgi:hypothetical protein